MKRPVQNVKTIKKGVDVVSTSTELKVKNDLRNASTRDRIRKGLLILGSKTNKSDSRIDRTSETYFSDKSYANISTMLNYFDDEWFDFDSLIKDRISLKIKGSIVRSIRGSYGKISSHPYRCDECKKPFQIFKDRANLILDYLDVDTYKNIPLESLNCREC
jgi:hypothetical protein|tara:strand:- start:933 stop:1415 length:483 start_codon:yes stop_codon:yes gene_type:complete